MSKYQDIKVTLQKMFNKHSDRQYQTGSKEGAEAENESMTEGHTPQIFGINRKIIYGLVGVFLVAFLGSLYFSASDKPDKSKTKKPTETVTPASNTNTQVPMNGNFPGDYSSLNRMANYDAQKTGKNATVNGNVRTNPRALPLTENESMSASSSLPPIATRSYAPASYQPSYSTPYPTYSYPYSQPVATITPQAPQTATSAAETMKENFKAAIQFALGKTDSGQEEKAKAVTQTAAAPASFGSSSYVEASPNILQVGTLIPAVLVTGINSDVGGQVIAQVESDVYDSLYGSTLLIPAGSRLIGQYSAGATIGQNRIGITWGTLVLPNGGSYSLGNSMAAVDGAGYAGLEGNVNNHTSKVLGAAGFTSALAALGSVAAGNAGTSSSDYSAGQLAAQGAMSNLLNTASSMLQKNLNIAPTITINPGYEFNAFVCQQISLNPYSL